MKIFQDGGLEQDGGTKDPVSGNDVPVGSMQEEVRDDVPAMVSEGEFVFPADVVRYLGLERLMKMRQEAKAGLKMMEKMGQMSNDSSELPDDVPFNPEDIMAEDDDGNMGELVIVKAKDGQDIKKTNVSEKYNQYMAGAGIKQQMFINPETGDEVLVYNVGGQLVPDPGPGYVLKGTEVAADSAIQESIQTTSPVAEREERDGSTTMFEGKIVPRGHSITLGADSADFVTKRGDDKFIRSIVNPKTAPAGWSTQNQFEMEQLQKKNYSVKALWNGQEWDVYSPQLDDTPFGTPGRRGLKPKYNLGQAIKAGAEAFGKGEGFMGVIKGAGLGNQQSYIDNLESAEKELSKVKLDKNLSRKTSTGTTRNLSSLEEEKRLKDTPQVGTTATSSSSSSSSANTNNDSREQEREEIREKFREDIKEQRNQGNMSAQLKGGTAGGDMFNKGGSISKMKQGGLASKKK